MCPTSCSASLGDLCIHHSDTPTDSLLKCSGDTTGSHRVARDAVSSSIPSLITTCSLVPCTDLVFCLPQVDGRSTLHIATTGSRIVTGWICTLGSFRFSITQDTLALGSSSAEIAVRQDLYLLASRVAGRTPTPAPSARGIFHLSDSEVSICGEIVAFARTFFERKDQ